MPLSDIELQNRQRELDDLRSKAAALEQSILEETAIRPWKVTGFYWSYYATTGFLLGLVASAVSLVLNVVGAPIVGKEPLELIRVYLTFPLGEQALALSSQADATYVVDSGVILAIGCCLYLGTGMLLGIPVYILLVRFTRNSTFAGRAVFAVALGVFLWAINFYLVLSWLQPLVCGGDWITSHEYLPWWVAAATHAVFGLTMAVLYPLGQYHHYLAPGDSTDGEVTHG